MTASKERVRVWDLPVRLFHWTLVIAIALAFLSAEEDSSLNQWHVLSGWVAGILVIFRIAWGYVGGEHSRFSDFIRPSRIGSHLSGLLSRKEQPTLGHNPLGGLSVLILLALTAVTVWSGAFGGEAAEELHEIVGWTLLAMVGLHVAAVIVMSFLERENLVRAMVRGDKPLSRHPGATDAKRPGAVGLIVAAVVLAGTVYAVLSYDPQAFTLRSAESYEHRADAAGDYARAEPEEDEDD